MKILLIDDEPIVHQTLGPFLTDCGYEVKSAYEGRQALSMISSDHFDVALIDLSMPGIDGLSVIAKIREIKPGLVIFIVTAAYDADLRERAMSFGARDLIPKPVELAKLDDRLMAISQELDQDK